MRSILAAFLAASNAWSQASAQWPDLSTPAPPQAGAEGDSALIVAVERYALVPPVPGAVDNGNDWYLYFTKTLGMKPSSVFLLRNNEGTLEKMRKFARLAARATGKGGRTWLVFIGHGAPSADGKDGILVGYDAQADVDSLYARSLSRAEFLEAASRGPDSRPILILDACFSGLTPSGRRLVEGVQPLVLVQSGAAGLSPNALVLSAGMSDQFAGPLPGMSRPAFSYLLLGALRGWADQDKNGRVSFAEALAYSREALQTLLTDRSQTPVLYGGRGAEEVVAAGEVGPDLTSLVLGRPTSPPASQPWEGAKTGPPQPPSRRPEPVALIVETPIIEVPSVQGGALGDIDIEVEEKLDFAKGLQKNPSADPAETAAAWCALASLTNKNPYLDGAKSACEKWKKFSEHLSNLSAGVMKESEKLNRLLALENKTKEEKLNALGAFISLYRPLGRSHHLIEARKAQARLLDFRVDLAAPDYRDMVEWMTEPENLGAVLESYAESDNAGMGDRILILPCVRELSISTFENDWNIREGVLTVRLRFFKIKKGHWTMDAKFRTGTTIHDFVRDLFAWGNILLQDPKVYNSCPRNK